MKFKQTLLEGGTGWLPGLHKGMLESWNRMLAGCAR